MAELTLDRRLNADQARVFAFISQPDHLATWWGPEGMHCPDHTLDFTKTGPWHSVMQNKEGQKYKVSGQVTAVDPPNSVAFTWAWHDENDKRGDESHVTLSLTGNRDGTTTLRLRHVQLKTEDAAASHEAGWSSSLNKLETLANQ